MNQTKESMYSSFEIVENLNINRDFLPFILFFLYQPRGETVSKQRKIASFVTFINQRTNNALLVG